jgi:large subunit ribosomal protein L17
MHRHGYVGRKLGRERDARRTLIRNMATSLVLDETVTTTLPKAKELLPFAERLIAKAKKGGLHNRRQIMSALLREDAANKLVDIIAPQIARSSGFLRLKRSHEFRHGDGAELAIVSFVDSLTESNPQPVTNPKKDSANASSSAPRKLSGDAPKTTTAKKTSGATSSTAVVKKRTI